MACVEDNEQKWCCVNRWDTAKSSCQAASKTQTDKETRPFVCSFVPQMEFDTSSARFAIIVAQKSVQSSLRIHNPRQKTVYNVHKFRTEKSIVTTRVEERQGMFGKRAVARNRTGLISDVTGGRRHSELKAPMCIRHRGNWNLGQPQTCCEEEYPEKRKNPQEAYLLPKYWRCFRQIKP